MRTIIGSILQGLAAGVAFALVGMWAWVGVLAFREWAKRNGFA